MKSSRDSFVPPRRATLVLHPPSSTLLSKLMAMAAISGIGNGIALKSGTFVLSRLEAEGNPAPLIRLEGSFGAALYLGMFCAALFVGEAAHRLGRRMTIIIGEVAMGVTSLACMALPSAVWAPTWRLALGVGMGFCVIAKPLYLAETAPSAHRGRVLGLFALSFPVGYLLIELIDYLPDGGDGSWRGWWRLEIGVGAVAPALLLLLVRHLPESPAFRPGGAADEGAGGGSGGSSGAPAKPAPQATATADEGSSLVPRGVGEEEAPAAADARRCRAAAALLTALTLAVEGCGTAGLTQFSKEMYDEVREQQGGEGMRPDAFYGSAFALACLVSACAVIGLIDSYGRRPLVLGGLGGLALCWAAYIATSGRLAAWARRAPSEAPPPRPTPCHGSSPPPTLCPIQHHHTPLSAPPHSCPRPNAPCALLARAQALVASAVPASLIGSTYFALSPELLPPTRRARLLGATYAAKFALAAATCVVWPALRRTIGRRALYGGYAAVAVGTAAFLAAFLPETKGRPLQDIWRDLR